MYSLLANDLNEYMYDYWDVVCLNVGRSKYFEPQETPKNRTQKRYHELEKIIIAHQFVHCDKYSIRKYINQIAHDIYEPSLWSYTEFSNNNAYRMDICCSWYYKNKIHRRKEPAVIYMMIFTKDGHGDMISKKIRAEHDQKEKGGSYISMKTWCKRNHLHNTRGPAIITYNSDKTISSERWYINGRLHRTDGPAYISYDDYGNISSSSN